MASTRGTATADTRAITLSRSSSIAALNALNAPIFCLVGWNRQLQLGMVGESELNDGNGVSRLCIPVNSELSHNRRLDGEASTLSAAHFIRARFTSRFFMSFPILAHERRRIVHLACHRPPEWTGQQLRRAFPWDTASRSLLHNRDRIYEQELAQQVQAMGIEEVLCTGRPSWQVLMETTDRNDPSRVPRSRHRD
jgi:hypothetical protein